MKQRLFGILFFALALSIGAYNQPKPEAEKHFMEPAVVVERPSCVIAGVEVLDLTSSVEENEELYLSSTDDELMLVDATAYYDERKQGHGADMRPLVEGLTVAGKVEWLGKSVYIYSEDMELYGIFEFRDTGYGRETGVGESKILPGKSIGTIEAGQTIDIYFETYEKCMEWGKRKVYIKIVEAEG